MQKNGMGVGGGSSSSDEYSILVHTIASEQNVWAFCVEMYMLYFDTTEAANRTVDGVSSGRADDCDCGGGCCCPVKTRKNTWSLMLMYSIWHSFMRHLFYACFFCSDVCAVCLYIKSGVSFNIYYLGLWNFYTSD